MSGKVLLASVLAAICAVYVLLLAPPLSLFDYEVAQWEILSEGLVAPFTFDVPLAGTELEQRRSETRESVPVYLQYDAEAWPVLEASLGRKLDSLGSDSAFSAGLLRELASMYDKGVVDMEGLRGSYSSSTAVLRRNSSDTGETPLGSLNIHGLEEVSAAFSSMLGGNSFGRSGDSSLIALLSANVVPDDPRREQSVEEALASMSAVDTIIVAGDTLVPPGGIVTGTTLRYLSALRSSGNSDLAGRQVRYRVGRTALLVGLMALGAVYVRNSMKESRSTTTRLLLLGTIWLGAFLATGLAWFVLRHLYRGSFATFVTFGAAMTAIFFHRRHAAAFSFLFAAAVAAGQPHPYSSLLVGTISGTLAGFAAWDLRRRSSIPTAAALASAGGLAVVAACWFLDLGMVGTPLWISAIEAILAPIAGLGLASSLVQPFERIFGVSTVLAIGEARNRNHPLLRELSQWAMGTWQHSQEVADLAAEAARAIEADAELAEAGGLFHDVGKLAEPRYFIENLPHLAGGNPHDSLPPSESVRKVVSHVAEGVRLARKFHVPSPIVDIIAQHHGTTCVKSFFEKAKQAAPAPDAVPRRDYSYPGPLPQTREAALVMLADAVESATKNLTEADRGDLEQIITRVLEDKDSDGQLDMCSITRGNLKSIRDAFLQVLQGRFHERVRDYPIGPDPQHRTAR